MIGDMEKYGFLSSLWIQQNRPPVDDDLYDMGLLNAMDWFDTKLLRLVQVITHE
jgi:hypothetical protein